MSDLLGIIVAYTVKQENLRKQNDVELKQLNTAKNSLYIHKTLQTRQNRSLLLIKTKQNSDLRTNKAH